MCDVDPFGSRPLGTGVARADLVAISFEPDVRVRDILRATVPRATVRAIVITATCALLMVTSAAAAPEQFRRAPASVVAYFASLVT